MPHILHSCVVLHSALPLAKPETRAIYVRIMHSYVSNILYFLLFSLLYSKPQNLISVKNLICEEMVINVTPKPQISAPEAWVASSLSLDCHNDRQFCRACSVAC